MKKSLKQSIMTSIKDGDIKPTAKWRYQLKAILFWFVFAVAVLIGAHAIGFIAHLLTMDNTPFIRPRGPRLGMHALMIPLFWVVAYGLFMAVAHWFFRHTPKGYKWSLSQLFGLNLLLSIMIGLALYAIGASHSFDRNIVRTFAPRLGGDQFRERIWNKPEEGSLVGRITSVKPGAITIKDKQQNNWAIALVDVASFAIGDHVGITGTKTDGFTFKADEIKVLPNRTLRR